MSDRLVENPKLAMLRLGICWVQVDSAIEDGPVYVLGQGNGSNATRRRNLAEKPSSWGPGTVEV